MMEWIDNGMRYWSLAMDAMDNVVMTVVIVIVTGLLAAVGGMISPRLRLYGAIAGGMAINLVVKAMGGGFTAALVAMVVVAILGVILGSVPFLVHIVKLMKKAPR